jgi:1-acyl-sn-glycerol-3-phosphate acyltransferase
LNASLKYPLLLAVKYAARTFYRFDVGWVGSVPENPWDSLRMVLILNHTSLYEPLFAGWVPNHFLKQLARDGVIPVADKTFCRPVVGRFFKLVAQKVVPVTRERDTTWERFVARVRANSLVILAPEGRMKRPGGLDLQGKPMTVRGGVADLLQKIPGGRMLIAYSGGLHHVQIPGQRLPKLFKTLKMRVESLDIAQYTRMIMENYGIENFKIAVIRDLEKRRSRYCHS